MTAADFAKRLQTDVDWFEDAWRALIPPADTRPASLHAAMHHSLFAAGKRLRPALCIAMCRACGGTPEAALHPAAAIECLHTYTLIHDDLPCMDDDDLRRGRPTCHKVFGEAIALLAGDALQALAFSILANAPQNALPMVRELARAAGSTAVVGGQVEDMEAEGLPADAERLAYIEEHKTGDLVICACRMGVLAAHGGPQQLEQATAYARAIGQAFQIADDILNATSTAEMLGKAVGTDAERQKNSAIHVFGMAGAQQRLATLTQEATAIAQTFPANTDDLEALARHIAERKK